MQFLKQTLEGRLFAAYILSVKTCSVLAFGESYCTAVQKQKEDLIMFDVLLHIDLQVTADPVLKGYERSLDTSSQLNCLHHSQQLV